MTNAGFDGTVNESQFAWMMNLGGGDGVADASAWKVSAGTGRSVSVDASGYAFAAGVLSNAAGTITKTISPTPTNGQWFLIVRRIDWSANAVTVEAVAHSTTSTTLPASPPSTYPAALQSTPGTVYDHLLAWAWVNSVNTSVAIWDMRGHAPVDRFPGRPRPVVPYAEAGVASFTLPATGWTSVPLVEPAALYGISWASTTPTRLTIVTSGRYRFTGHATIPATVAAQGRVFINGATRMGEDASGIVAGAGYPNTSVELTFAPGNYLEFQLASDSGGAVFDGRVTLTYIGAGS